MQIIQKASDTLDIDLVKEHLVVEHDEDDVLIMQYMEASALIASAYIHKNIFKTEYSAITSELQEINGTFLLDLDVRPEQLFVTQAGGSYSPQEIPSMYFSFDAGNSTLLFSPPNVLSVSDITVFTGAYKDEAQINQARLLLIGTFYNYRESVADLRLTEVPHAFKMILDNISAGSL